jgi:hypothetical protein
MVETISLHHKASDSWHTINVTILETIKPLKLRSHSVKVHTSIREHLIGHYPWLTKLHLIIHLRHSSSIHIEVSEIIVAWMNTCLAKCFVTEHVLL